MTVMPSVLDAEATLATTALLSDGLNPWPPYALGTMSPKNRSSLSFCQTASDRSRRCQTSQSSTIWQSSSTGPSMNACSSSVRPGVVLSQQPLAVGLAGEQLALDPDRPGVDGLLLGAGDDGQELEPLHQPHHGAREHPADRRDQEDGGQHREGDHERQRRAEADERDEPGRGPHPQRGAGEAEREQDQEHAERGGPAGRAGEKVESVHREGGPGR